MTTFSPETQQHIQAAYQALKGADVFRIADSPILSSWYAYDAGLSDGHIAGNTLPGDTALHARWESEGEDFDIVLSFEDLANATFDEKGFIQVQSKGDDGPFEIHAYALTPSITMAKPSVEAAATGRQPGAQDAREVTTFDLVLSVDVRLNGTQQNELVDNLRYLVNHAMSEGLVTTATDAEVSQHRVSVSERPDIPLGTLVDFMADRIENGALSLEDLPRRLAQYGVMPSAEFLAEMEERMVEMEFGPYGEPGGVVSAPAPRG